MSSEVDIHPAAVVEAGARLGHGVRIGPFCHVGAEVELGDGVELASHVSVSGATTLGAGCKVSPMAVLGGAPQNAKHKGGRTTLTVGANCTIREGVTIHRGTDTSRGATTVGNNCNFLAYTHVAHDCSIGSNVTMANLATLAGHCEVGDFVNIGGLAAVHQFTRIGHHAFIGGMAGVEGDVMPYGMVLGERATLRGLNIVGMKRSGLPRAEIHALRKAFRLLANRSGSFSEALAEVSREMGDSQIVAGTVDFFSQRAHRFFLVPGPGEADDDSED